MTSQEFVSLVESVSESPSGSLRLSSKLEEFGWDSLAVIGLISELDRRGGTSVAADSIADAATVNDLYTAAFGS